MNFKSIFIVGLCVSVSACVTAGQREQANVFSTSDVNKRQETKLVEIINIEAGKVEVDNKSEQQAAAFAGLGENVSIERHRQTITLINKILNV